MVEETGAKIDIEDDLETTLYQGSEEHIINKGDRTIDVKVGNEEHTVGGNRTLTIHGDETHETCGEFKNTVEKDYTLEVDKDMKQTIKGKSTIKVTGDLVIDVTGSITFKSGAAMNISSGTAMKIQSGPAPGGGCSRTSPSASMSCGQPSTRPHHSPRARIGPARAARNRPLPCAFDRMVCAKSTGVMPPRSRLRAASPRSWLSRTASASSA